MIYERNNKQDFIKIKIFWSVKDAKRNRRQATNRENIYKNTTDKGLLS